MDGLRVEGRCLCGAVRFSVRTPTLWAAHCHCSICRSAHGAPFVTWVGVDAQGFEVLAGEADLRRYPSSTHATRTFCGTCGSPLFFESERWAGQIHVARAALPGAIDREPQAHVFYSDRAPWIDIRDDLPRRGGPSGMEPLE